MPDDSERRRRGGGVVVCVWGGVGGWDWRIKSGALTARGDAGRALQPSLLC